MTIGASYRGKAVAAVLGPDRSTLFPSRLYLSAATAGGVELTDRVRVDASAWQIVGDGVANTSALDAGEVAVSGTVARLRLWDAASGGSVVLEATVPPVTVAVGDLIAVAVGDLTFEVGA